METFHPRFRQNICFYISVVIRPYIYRVNISPKLKSWNITYMDRYMPLVGIYWSIYVIFQWFKGVTRDVLVVSQSWPNLVFRLNRPRGILWYLYFYSSMCGLEVRRVARYSRAPSFSAVFYRIEIFYLIIFYPNGTYKTSTSFFHHMFSLYFLIRYVFEWEK